MECVNTYEIYDQIKDKYLSFVLTTACRNNEKLYHELEQLFNSNDLLWRDLIVQAAPEYEIESVDLINAVGFEKSFSNFLKESFSSPYKHQTKAWNTILEGNNCVLATGTGSGKTEAFLFPLISHCIEKQHNGVQSIIVYPLKALANDQGNRIGNWLDKINEKFGTNIKYGIFDGDTGKRTPSGNKSELCDKETFKKSPPNILLTNYVMLERILLHPEYIKILNNPDVKFVVLDEIHYYRGAQGIDVSLLLRRLQFHLAQVQDASIQYVGTSATLGNPQSKDVTEFLSKLFNASFKPESIISPTYSISYSENTYAKPQYLKEIKEDLLSLDNSSATKSHSFFCSPPSLFRCLNCGKINVTKTETCSECNSTLLFEITTCRQCGEEYLNYEFTKSDSIESDILLQDLDIIEPLELFNNQKNTEKMGDLILSEKKHNDSDIKVQICPSCFNLYSDFSIICDVCNEELIELFAATGPNKDKVILNKESNNKYCPSCGFQESRMDLIVPISKISDENCSHIIFEEFFMALPENRKKLLLFTDNVQRTSKFAREIEETHLKNIARTELQKIIEKSDDNIELSDIVYKVTKNIKKRTTVDKYLKASIEKELYEELLSTGKKVGSLANRGLFELEILDLDQFDPQNQEKIKKAFEVFKKNKQVLGYYQIINQEGVYSYSNFLEKPKLIEQIYRSLNNLYRKKLPKDTDYSEARSVLELLKDHEYLDDLEGKYFFKEDYVELCKLKDINPVKNYYMEWSERGNIPIIKSKIDTGKTSPEERAEVEADFKSSTDRVNFLVSTPTLELGIDIGDLDVVGLLYAPPSPAQYVQRIGRAGRSGQSSLAVTYLSKRTLDSTYFYEPIHLVEGIINPPAFSLDLEIPTKKALFSLFLYYTLQYTDFKNIYDGKSWKKVSYWENNIGFIKRIWNQYERGFNAYLESYLNMAKIQTDTSNLIEEWANKLEEYMVLQKALSVDKNYQRTLDIFNYFQGAGLLPDYAFGTGGSVVFVPYMSPINGFTLKEVCPPSTLDYNKSRFSCTKVDLYHSKTKTIANSYKQCPYCDNVLIVNAKNSTCPICNTLLVMHDKSIIDPKVIKAKRSTFSLTQKRINWAYNVVDLPVDIQYNEHFVSNPFACDIGFLFESVNEDGKSKNYDLCSKCGEFFSKESKRAKYDNHTHTPSNSIVGSKFKSRTIIMDYSNFDINDPVTFINALISAITLESGCEDGEIGGIILENSSKLIFFDDVEGGVGFVDVLSEHFERVINTAKQLCLQECCEHGCVRCIGSFWRQKDLDYLRKKEVIPTFEQLLINNFE